MAKEKVDNMSLWNKVCKTDPANTKKVSQRGGFTAICAQSQFKAATEQFGAFGQGWWIADEKFTFLDEGMCLYQAVMEFNEAGQTDISSSIQWCKSGRPDADFAKKVSTDAITKALSRMGFNSDVFEGKYDDNKYVAEMTQEFSEPVKEDKKAEFVESIKALKGEGKYPTTKEGWLSYIRLLFDELGMNPRSIEEFEVDSPIWSKLSDTAAKLHTVNQNG